MDYDEDWVDARTRELLADLEHRYGRGFDRDGAADLVRAYLVCRGTGANWPWSEEDREALGSGAAMALLGKEYRPPSPTSRYAASVNLPVALNAAVGLCIAAVDWQRRHTEVPDAEHLREILANLVEWLYSISETSLDLADASKPAAHPRVENVGIVANRVYEVAVDKDDDADVVVIEARHASRSADLLALTAANLETDYQSLSEQDEWMSSAAVCAGLSTSVDELRRATGAG